MLIKLWQVCSKRVPVTPTFQLTQMNYNHFAPYIVNEVALVLQKVRPLHTKIDVTPCRKLQKYDEILLLETPEMCA